MIVDDCQRYNGRRLKRVPANGTIRTTDYEVAPITSSAVARGYIKARHYAGTASSDAHRFGLYRHGNLVGVALFGPPASMNAHRLVWPTLDPGEAVTLGRLFLDEEVEGNGESWMFARCMELLANPRLYRPLDKHGLPRRPIVGVESCADPVVRTDIHGRRIFNGHAGTLYQASNGRFVGRTRRERHKLLPDGRVFSRRSISKIQGAERGWFRDAQHLVAFGVDPIDPDADRPERKAWLDDALDELARDLVHDGCLRYVWALPVPVPLLRDERREESRRFGVHVWEREQRRRRAAIEHWPALPYLKIDALRAATAS